MTSMTEGMCRDGRIGFAVVRRGIGFLALITLVFPVGLPAQIQPDTRTLLRLAISELRTTTLPAGRLVLDDHFFDASLKRGQLVRSRRISEQLAEYIGAQGFVRFEEVVSCEPNSPSSCRMVGNVSSALAISEPVISVEQASVVVWAKYRTLSERVPVARWILEISFSRRGASWVVDDVAMISGT